jgi:phosphate transport system substrate-binding protein
LLAGSCLSLSAGCGAGTPAGGDGRAGKSVIRVEGSDTMVNLAQAWAEEYSKIRPEVSIQVSGGGSGVGIASLIDGVASLANSSRKMKKNELARAEENTGKIPVEHVVGMDTLAVYVHKDNPLDTITIDQLAGIYGEGGTITQWSQLGVQNAACKTGEITRVSRQNNSGTYHYFREAVLGERDYKLGSIDQSGSKDVVALISRTPCAIGYSGMGYKTDEVKWLKIAAAKGAEGVAPSVEAALDGSYPIARPLLIYTLGEPAGALKDYLDWIRSEAGQQIVIDLGYVPLAERAAAAPDAEASAEPSAVSPAAGAPVAAEQGPAASPAGKE